jgi:hypothetical protein
MGTLTVADLAQDAEREFRGAFGDASQPALCRTFSESSFRGGFELVLSYDGGRCEVVYSDMELEVRFNGREVFGTRVHAGFEGNMFSRDHLREYLPRIAASAAETARTNNNARG